MNGWTSIGLTGFYNITATLLCILLAWWALQTFRFDLFVKDPKGPKARMLQVIVAIVLGYQLGQFLLDYAYWSSMLKRLF